MGVLGGTVAGINRSVYSIPVAEYTYEKLNARQVKALADDHCGMYEARLRHASEGHRGIRVDECRALLALWRSIDAKLTQDNWRLRLTKAEVNEIRDALAEGSYDDMLGACQDPPS